MYSLHLSKYTIVIVLIKSLALQNNYLWHLLACRCIISFRRKIIFILKSCLGKFTITSCFPGDVILRIVNEVIGKTRQLTVLYLNFDKNGTTKVNSFLHRKQTLYNLRPHVFTVKDRARQRTHFLVASKNNNISDDLMF